MVVRGPVALGERGAVEARFLDKPCDRLQVRHARLATPQPERHVAVGAGPDLTRAPDGGARTPAAEAGSGEPAAGAHVGDEHDLLHRDVDPLRPHARRQRGECRERCLRTGVAPGRRFRAPHRCAVGVASGVHVAARGHDAEVARPPARARAVEPERGDADPHGAWRERRVELGRARPPRCVEDDVGLGQHRPQRRLVDRGLARIPGQPVDVAAAAGVVEQANIGPQVAQDARRHLRRFTREVDDPEAGEEPLSHWL